METYRDYIEICSGEVSEVSEVSEVRGGEVSEAK